MYNNPFYKPDYSTLLGGISSLNPLFSLPPIKRKVFISFHHKNDQWAYDYFSTKFSETHDIFHDRSIGETLVRSDDPEYVDRAIRDDYIKGSSLTIVLCGAETFNRKYVDWEIHSTLHHEHALLGIGLYNAPRNIHGHAIVPARLHHNIASGYAHFITWVEDAVVLKNHIDHAIQRSQQKSLIINHHEKMSRNS